MGRARNTEISGALFVVMAILFMLELVPGCGSGSREEEIEIMPREDIKQVMEAHVDGLMAIPGVTGVAIGALDDGTPCIMVYLLEDSAELRRTIPEKLEGHPVVINVSGPIRAMPDEAE